jgi:hypothetical protein
MTSVRSDRPVSAVRARMIEDMNEARAVFGARERRANSAARAPSSAKSTGKGGQRLGHTQLVEKMRETAGCALNPR